MLIIQIIQTDLNFDPEHTSAWVGQIIGYANG